MKLSGDILQYVYMHSTK